MKNYDFAVIGGGIIGASIFYKLNLKYPNCKIILLEKENKLANHQTGRNSGVIHSGLYYKPNSLKAKTCINGYKQLIQFCKSENIKHEICGKIVVAKSEKEISNLLKLKERGEKNGLKGIDLIDQNQISKIEPFIKGVKGLFVPQTGIVDYVDMTNKLVEKNSNANATVKRGFKVLDLISNDDTVTVKSENSSINAKKVFSCTGLFSDRLAKLTNEKLNVKIVPFRGDYYELKEKSKHLINNLVYPVPDPDLPFLGVHFTRMFNGKVECGPNAVFNFKREGYGKFDFNFEDTFDSLSFPGTWKLFSKHVRFGINEYSRAFSKILFLRALREFLPSLKMSDLVQGRSGVRAQALDKNGNLLDDFSILSSNNITHVINAPSPAATASMAIADHILNNSKL